MGVFGKHIFLASLLFLSSCKRTRNDFGKFHSKQQLPDIITESGDFAVFPDEARLCDIFFPIDVQPVRISCSDERKVIVNYKSSFSANNIISLYRTEMEYLGWEEAAIFEGAVSCLVFQKPSKMCIVTIATENKFPNFQEILLFIGNKKYYDERY